MTLSAGHDASQRVGTGRAMVRSEHGKIAPLKPVSFRRREIRLAGRVQGIGFRPFIYLLARQYELTGFVRNDGRGVTIEVQGSPEALDHFIRDVKIRKPSLSIIREATARHLPLKAGEDRFQIVQSEATLARTVLPAPDLAVCPECLRDIRNEQDRRRLRYALTNCTACGPRFSIVREVPYDRGNTTMRSFPMCRDCRNEFEDPADRRFHAQPVACHSCGPNLEMVDPHGTRICGDPLSLAAEGLLQGQVIAIKGIGGFHLAVRADDARAVERLRQLKHRPCKPFAMMVGSANDAGRIVRFSRRGLTEFSSAAAPIVLAPRLANARVAPAVAPGSHRLGVMLAYTPLHHLIFDALRGRCAALVMTSANDSDEPLIFSHRDAVARLGDNCDGILWHDREIQRAVDDSVLLDVGEHDPIVVRRSRGYVPTPLALPDGCRSTGICLGGELKNTVAVVRDGEAVLSQHLGDLQNARTYGAFKRAVTDLMDLTGVRPQWVAHDTHPAYVSALYAAQLASSLRVPRVTFQHHHAHAAAVLAEHGQVGPALAVVCDGTGYGSDGTIWGGELLWVDFNGFRRLGHLRPLRLPGGDAAAKQPWRSAMALLLNAFGDQFAEHPIVEQLAPDAEQARFVAAMLRTRTSCVSSSSAGRVFDGVAALLGICRENHFEAQAPMALESAAWEFGTIPATAGQPLFDLREHGEIDLSPLVRELVGRRLHGAPAEELAWLFHDQFVAAWEAAVMRAVEQTRLIEVVLSGGVLCNELINCCLSERLAERGLHVLRHRLVPPNDGGLALGQAALASHWAANGLVEKVR